MISNTTRPSRARWLIPGVLALVLAAAPAPAAAQDGWDFGVRGGVYADDVDGPFVGVEALTRIGESRWYFNPNVEAAFGDDLDVLSASADAHYDFHVDGPAVWAGAGITALRYDPSVGDEDSELGVNGLIGIGARRGNFRPFGQLKVVLADESELVVMGGVRF